MLKCATFQQFSGLIEKLEKSKEVWLSFSIRNLQGKNLSCIIDLFIFTLKIIIFFSQNFKIWKKSYSLNLET